MQTENQLSNIQSSHEAKADSSKQSGIEKNNTKWTFQKRNIFGGLIHGSFTQFGLAFSQDTSVLPAFIHALTGSGLLVGLLSAVQRAGSVLPQLFFANFLETRRYKRPYLIRLIYLRSAAWFILGIITVLWGNLYPNILAGLLFVLLAVFFFTGGLGELIYSYLIASTISPTMRGRFFGIRFLLGGTAGAGAGFITHYILSTYNNNLSVNAYGWLFLLTSFSFILASVGFHVMRENADYETKERRPFTVYFKDTLQLVKKDNAFLRLLWQNIMLAGIYFALPFYVVFAQVMLEISAAQLGIYITLQIIGQTISGIAWGWIGDKSGYRLVLIGISSTAFLTPLWAVFSSYVWPAAFAVTFFLAGFSTKSADMATRNYLLEISSTHQVPTCLALKNTLMAPTLLFPIIGGLLIKLINYQVLFLISALVTGIAIIISFHLYEPREVGNIN